MAGTLVRAWHLKQWRRAHRIVTHPWSTFRFLVLDRETTNFTYPIRNRGELLSFLADDVGLGPAVTKYAQELENDAELLRILNEGYRGRKDRNREARLGRRLGWYCIVRATKPRTVFETGTHDGLGAAVFARAFQKNAAEGKRGTVYSFDIDPQSGWLVTPELRRHVGFVRGDIRETLPKTLRQLGGVKVDLFLHDSIHTYEHETWEFETVAPHLASGGLFVTDNAHDAPALKDFAAKRGLAFKYWREKPKGHPHPGGSIGLAWNRPIRSMS